MVAVTFHARRRHRPCPVCNIELGPLCSKNLSRARRGEYEKLEGESNGLGAWGLAHLAYEFRYAFPGQGPMVPPISRLFR